ncbi:MAG: glycine betaine ABC transporter substrate-binding protein [Gammaproteobacteria bacterium]
MLLEEPPYKEGEWKVVSQKDDPEWLEKSNVDMEWPKTYIHIHYAKSLEETHPDAAALLSSVKLDADTVAAMMFEVDDKKRDPLEVAKEWAAKNSGRVESWFGN